MTWRLQGAQELALASAVLSEEHDVHHSHEALLFSITRPRGLDAVCSRDLFLGAFTDMAAGLVLSIFTRSLGDRHVRHHHAESPLRSTQDRPALGTRKVTRSDW